MTDLLRAQFEFMEDLSCLIRFIYEMGYTCTGGELLRSREDAINNAKKGTGISNSLHTQKLAIDINLFKDGKYLSDTESHRIFGEYWKGLRPENCWGGDFKRPDGNHYSHTYGGIK